MSATTKAPRTVVKEVPNAKLYSDGTILIKNVRFSYPHVLKPKAGTDDNGNPTAPSYSIVGLMDKKTHVAAKNLIKETIDGILKEKKIDRLAKDKIFLRNGDDAAKDGYDGMFTVSAREQESRPPTVRGPDKKKWTEADIAKIYGGCYGNILIRPWFQSNKYGKRVNATLTAVQFIRDGEAFGEGRISDEDIDETFDDESEGVSSAPDDDDDL